MELGLEELVLVVLDRVAKAQASGQEVWVEECSEQEASGLAEVRELEQATYLEVDMEVVMVQVLVNTQELVELVPNLLKQVMGLVVPDLDLVVLELGLAVQDLDLVVPVLGLAVQELDLVALDLGLAVPELGLVVLELGLAVQVFGLAVQVFGLVVLELGLAVPESGLAVPESDLAVQESDLAVQDSGLAVQDSGLAVQDSDLPVQESDLAVQDSGLAVQESDLAVQDSGLAVQESDLAVQDSGLAVQESDLAVQDSGLAVQESDLAVQDLGLAVQESDLAVQDLGLAVQELDLAVQDLGLAVQESVLVELLCQEEFQCCHRLARLGEDLEERAVVKHQNKFQELGCLDSIKVDMYQAKVLEAVVFSLEWPQDLDLGLRLGPGYSARGVLDQEEQAMAVDSSCLGFSVVTLSYHQKQGRANQRIQPKRQLNTVELQEVHLVKEALWGLGLEDCQVERESHRD
ncbi:uncharacterized protein LOC119476377 isoform X2 [Sebastes umbrosus]|uniref:uncharacterized protein LOC119476377 isoform X2 n=1 Tax=Sebastes umbrosus TaxID=72105 RepID=UPI0018A12047|nr:uncharacterized protein LOC119476377 isoform X2 [Sebastes umbrosus]XP_037605751.1 uncharacterized protein LOC119476377 isoform X2 [Sebastes umbrosus]